MTYLKGKKLPLKRNFDKQKGNSIFFFFFFFLAYTHWCRQKEKTPRPIRHSVSHGARSSDLVLWRNTYNNATDSACVWGPGPAPCEKKKNRVSHSDHGGKLFKKKKQSSLAWSAIKIKSPSINVEKERGGIKSIIEHFSLKMLVRTRDSSRDGHWALARRGMCGSTGQVERQKKRSTVGKMTDAKDKTTKRKETRRTKRLKKCCFDVFSMFSPSRTPFTRQGGKGKRPPKVCLLKSNDSFSFACRHRCSKSDDFFFFSSFRFTKEKNLARTNEIPDRLLINKPTPKRQQTNEKNTQ